MGGGFYTEASSDGKEPAIGRSKRDAVMTEKREKAKPPPKKQAQMASQVLSQSNSLSYVLHDSCV